MNRLAISLCFSIALGLPLAGIAQAFTEKSYFDLEPATFYVQAIAHHDAGNLASAADMYERTLSADPLHLSAWYNLSLARYGLGQYPQAEKAMESLLALSPTDTAAYELYGLILHRVGRHEQAVASFGLVLSSTPSAHLFANRAMAYLANNDMNNALPDLDAALRLDPSHFNAVLGKGMALSELAQYQLALEWFDHALQLRPGQPLALSNRAVLFFQNGERERALNDFRSVLSKHKLPEVFAARARCYLSAGEPNEAWLDMQEALHLAPDLPELLELMALIEKEWKQGQAADEDAKF